MRRLFTLLFLILIGLHASQAQNTIKFELKHFLGQAPFALNQTATNDMTQDFSVTRLQYYISGIEIVHDGGQVTSVPNYYILADASTNQTYDLGTHMITTIEAFRFSVGVDSPTNHLDPSTYPANHPLSPKLPSMHWGWTSGYRFIAMEGKCGNGLGRNYELHALGNPYYHGQHIKTGGVVNANEITVTIHADYVEALSGINISSGPVVHGDFGLSRTLMQNFWMRVFSSTSGQGNNVSAETLENPEINLFPNPSIGNAINLALPPGMQSADMSIIDMTGKVVYAQKLGAALQRLQLDLSKGLYFVELKMAKGYLSREKLLIQ